MDSVKKQHFFVLIAFLGAVLSPFEAQARPISYAGGWTIMQMNDGDSNSLHLHYSPTQNYSVGYKGEYFRDKEWQFHGGQLNYLAYRNNQRHSQSNLYFKTALGVAYSDFANLSRETEASGFAGLAYDWENRDYFISYENRYVYAGDIDGFYKQSARLGITPYVGEYGDVHTWFMVQFDHMPEAEDKKVTITPLVRVFQGRVLGELGVSNTGKVMANWTVRF